MGKFPMHLQHGLPLWPAIYDCKLGIHLIGDSTNSSPTRNISLVYDMVYTYLK